MKSYTYLLLFGVLLGASCVKRDTDIAVQTCSPDFGWVDTSVIHPKHAVFSKLIKDLTQAGIPGISLMVEDQSGVWYGSSGYADLENQIPMMPCHLGKIASVTKLYTAVMIYKLVDQGVISLDDPLSKFIDGRYINKIKNSDRVKVRDLLNHSSGIYDVVFDPEFILYTFNNLDKEKSYEKLLSFAYDKDAAFKYGTKREYNQTLNHVLLASIINRVTSVDQSVYFKSEILIPLQLANTYMRPQMNLPWQRVAKGYYDYRKKGILQDLTPLYTGDGRGFTGIYTDVNDLRIFTNALFRNNSLISNSSYLSMTEIPEMDTTLRCAGGCRAMKINVDGNNYTWYGHPGGEVNYASGAFYCPEIGATITYIMNYGVAFSEMGAYTDLYFDFRRKLFQEVSRQ